MISPTRGKKYVLVATPATVSSKVDTHIKKLSACGFGKERILDVYLEAQKLSASDRFFVSAAQRKSGLEETSHGSTEIRFKDHAQVCNDAMHEWRKISPGSFLQQWLAYFGQGANDTGIENGFVRELFLSFSLQDERLLVIDPHPAVMEKLLESGKDVTIAFTGDRFCEAYQTRKASFKLERFDNLPNNHFDRVLIFASFLTGKQIQDMLESIRHSLVPKKKTKTCILMQTKHLEKRHSQPELWDYLNQHFKIQKISLIDKNAIKTQPKKRCFVILENDPGRTTDVLVQKTKLISDNMLATLEFRRIPFSSFADRDRTLSEMYEKDYTDYTEPNRREKPTEYKFSDEISIWVSCCCGENGRYRPYYSLYDYPSAEQLRRNTLPRGKPIKTSIPGKWYKTKEEAIASAEELLLKDKALAKEVRVAVRKQFSGCPISIKTHVFLHWEEILTAKGVDEELCRTLFYTSFSAKQPLNAMMVGNSDGSTIKEGVDSCVLREGFSKTREDSILKQLQVVCDFAVIDGKCDENPVRKMIRSRSEQDKTTRDLRSALVARSFSKDTEKVLFSYLLADKENETLAIMLLTKYFTHLPNSILCALTWGDYVFTPCLGLSQLSITKFFPFRSLQAEPIMPEERRRFVPLVSLVSELIEGRIAKGERKSLKHPLFAHPKSRSKPITPRQLQTYFNAVLEKLGLESYQVMRFEDDKQPESSDLNNYGGDILLSNFDFHGYYDACLEPEEIDFIAGRKPGTTEAQFYCDYDNIFLQLIMRIKLDRWVASLLPENCDSSIHCLSISGGEHQVFSTTASNKCNEVYIEIEIDENVSMEDIVINAYALYGGHINIMFF